MGKWFVVAGIILVMMGLLWPWIVKLGLGHLPGDIRVERGNFSFYFPLTSCIIVSLIITLLLWLFRH